MRDILNKLNHITNEVSIAKPKYGPGTQFAVSAGSQSGQKLLDLMQQQGFDPTPPLTMQDTSQMGEKEILNLPTVVASAGGEGYLFTNSAGQFILVTGSSSSIGPMFNVYKGPGLDGAGAEVKAGISNRGETSEGILGAAMFAKFTKRESGEEIGTVTPGDIGDVLDTLKKTGEDQYEVEVEDYDNVHADKVTFVLRLKTAPYNDLMDPAKRDLLTSEFASAAAYVNSSDAERYSRYFYINGKADRIIVMADGVTGEKTQKTDVWVYVTDEDGKPRKLRLNTSLKVGGVAQFGQVGGSTVETQQTLWNYFGVDVDPALDDFADTVADDSRAAFKQVYEYAADQINQELQDASPEDEAGVINNIAQGITHFATLGDPKVELVDFSSGGFKIMRFNNLVKKLKSVDLEATYVDSKAWPEVVIHERGDPKNKLLTVRMKVENTKSGPYARNYIEKGPLLEKLTEVKKASWGTEPSADLDKVTQQRSSVKAAAPEPEKLGTEKSLGRKRQR
jgi:hypothetical protein